VFEPIAIVLKGYPRLSETFIAEEVRGLERRGLNVRLYSMRLPTDPAVHPVHREIRARISYLPEYLHDQPIRVWRCWRIARRLPGYSAALSGWLRDLCRDRSRSRLRRFGQAMVLAAELPADIRRLHAHFLHTPASVTRYAAIMRDLPWSVSAHAKDVWTIPQWEKREKLADCAWAATCTRANAAHLAALAPEPGRIALLYHGLDLGRWPPPTGCRPTRDGQTSDDPVVVLSVGRLVAKKGYRVLLQALARLPGELSWRFVHIGGGPLFDALKKQAHGLGLSDRITWLGARSQPDVLAAYRAADLFVLACRIAEDGDRDGLPNVLLEAQSQGLACISTAVSAIPELIDDGETGVIVPPDDPIALALAIERSIRCPNLRSCLGSAGMRQISRRFSSERSLDQLAAHFRVEEKHAHRVLRADEVA
jgi:glycosyltransferase involved in cell wall biosynthesis